MYLVWEIIFILLLAFSLFLLIKDSKHPEKLQKVHSDIPFSHQKKKILIIIFLCTYIFYSVLDYIFNTDILAPVTFHKHGASFSFIGMVLFIATTLIIFHIIEAIKKYIASKKGK